jgi:pyrophosphatase PpaX
MKKKYSAFLFDADGTLIDTTELIYQCFVHTLELFSGPKLARELIVSHIGLPLYAQLGKYFGEMEKDRADEIAAAHMEYQLSIADRYLRAFPGAAEVLSKLASQGMKLAVVTSRRMNTTKPYLEKTGLAQYFRVIVTPECTQNHKPHPEPALKAIELLKCDASEALMIGDSSYDIECGAGAKIDTAFVGWSQAGVESLKVRPTMIVNNFSELASVVL